MVIVSEESFVGYLGDEEFGIHLSVKIWVMIVHAMLRRPETPDARKADVVEDSPACEKSTGAYYAHRVFVQLLEYFKHEQTYIEDTINSTCL